MTQFNYVDSPRNVPQTISGDVLYIDVETFGVAPNDALDLLTNRVRLLSIAGETGPAWVFDLFYLTMSDVQHLLRPDAEWCGHNLAFDLAALHRAGVPYPAKCLCTMVGSQVLINGLDPAQHGGHRLDECLARYCETQITKTLGGSDWSATTLTDEQIEYSANDTLCLRPLRAQLLARLEARRLMPIAELEWACVPAVTQMTLNGIRIDRAAWTERSRAAETRVAELTKELVEALPLPPEEPYKVVRISKNGNSNKADVSYNQRIDAKNAIRSWNFASNDQVIQAFDGIGVKLPDNKYDTLVEHAHESPLLDLMLQFKDVEKEATTFGMDWLVHLRDEHGTDRVHPSWWQLGTRSGRMSCSGPNMQQIPHGKARKAIIASDGYLLVRADFSQIEARVAAKISGDETLSRLFIDNTGDIHRFTASRVLGKEPHEVTDDDRQIGKSLLFGLLFGMGAKKLRIYCRTNYGVKLTPQEAEVFRNKFFGVFPGLARWHDRVKRTCENQTDYRSLLGRRRLVMSDIMNRLTIALNTPVQGSAADLLKATVREVWETRAAWPRVKMVGLIHDEIMTEVPEAEAGDFAKYLKATMIEVGNKLLDPIPVDAVVKVGKSWGK